MPKPQFETKEYVGLTPRRLREVLRNSTSDEILVDFSIRSHKGKIQARIYVDGIGWRPLHRIHPPIVRAAALHRYAGKWRVDRKAFERAARECTETTLIQLTMWPPTRPGEAALFTLSYRRGAMSLQHIGAKAYQAEALP